MTSNGVVSRSTFRHLKPITSPAELPLVPRAWSSSDWIRIRAGVVPREMEEKWLAFVEGNRLFVHRSWTGHGIYEATFSESGAEWHITSAVVEDDRTRHQRVSDVGEILRLELLIESVSLGCHRRDAWTAWYEAYAHDPTRVSGRGSGWPCTCG